MSKETLHVYTRVSTQTQKDEGTSLESQKELGIKKAKDLGLNYKIWNEGGASSHYEDLQNRPVLLSLLSEINSGNVSHLWVYNNDRLSRNEITAQTIRVALQKHGVTLYTQNGKFDLNNPQDKLIKTIFDGLAQFDNALRAERTRLGKIHKIKKGFWMGGPPPFGYQIKDKKLELHPDESKWVKNIYEWYGAGRSTEWIRSNLNQKGVETRRDKKSWSLGSIQKILQNTHPIGHYTYIDSKTQEAIKCVCAPIVSATLWNKCQEKRKQILARRGQNNRTKRFYLLRNLLYCGHCGSPMSGRIKEDKKEYLYYCPRKEREWPKSGSNVRDKWKRGVGCLMTRSLNIPATDNLIVTKILPIVYNKDILLKGLKELKKGKIKPAADQNVESRQLKIKLDRLKKELGIAIQNIADVESARMLGRQDKRIADKVIENLNSVLRETEAKIEQCELQIHALRNEHNILDLQIPPTGNLQMVEMKGIDISPKWQPIIKSFVERIDVSYNKESNEHQLVVRFKLPLIHGKNELNLKLKKNKKAA